MNERRSLDGRPIPPDAIGPIYRVNFSLVHLDGSSQCKNSGRTLMLGETGNTVDEATQKARAKEKPCNDCQRGVWMIEGDLFVSAYFKGKDRIFEINI